MITQLIKKHILVKSSGLISMLVIIGISQLMISWAKHKGYSKTKPQLRVGLSYQTN